MTNIEDTNTPADLPADAVEPVNYGCGGLEGMGGEAEVPGDELETSEVIEPAFIDTEPEDTTEWAQPGSAFRYLNWINSAEVQRQYSVNIAKFSVERQEGVRDLINHGLVTERTWVGGQHDGRVTYRLTALGKQRLSAAREAASLLVLG